jgi:hypothetical protein
MTKAYSDLQNERQYFLEGLVLIKTQICLFYKKKQSREIFPATVLYVGTRLKVSGYPFALELF